MESTKRFRHSTSAGQADSPKTPPTHGMTRMPDCPARSRNRSVWSWSQRAIEPSGRDGHRCGKTIDILLSASRRKSAAMVASLRKSARSICLRSNQASSPSHPCPIQIALSEQSGRGGCRCPDPRRDSRVPHRRGSRPEGRRSAADFFQTFGTKRVSLFVCLTS